MAGLLRTQDPQAEEEQAQRRRDGQVDMEQRAVAPHTLLVPAFDGLGLAQVHRPQPRMLAGDAGHAHPDGVDAVAHRGFGQAPVARHVPAARQRLGLAGVAPQQVVVGVDLAGHDDGFERQRGRSATRAVTAPVDPVPGLAGMAGPARAQSSGSVTGRQAGPSAGRAPSGRAWAMRTSRIRAAQSPAASAVAARAPPHRISSASRPSIAASACPARRATGVGRVNRAGRASAAWMARVREDTASLR